MELLNYVSYFFGGAFAVNAIPHLVAALMGEPFQWQYNVAVLSVFLTVSFHHFLVDAMIWKRNNAAILH